MKKLNSKIEKIQDTVYPDIPPEERFQLALTAAAEGNDEERKRLVKSCPKKNYRMNEAAFVDRIETAETLTLAFAIDLAGLYGRFQLAIAVEDLLLPILDKETDYSLASEMQHMTVIRKTLQGQIKSLWEGFSEVCLKDMGLKPEIPLAVFFPPALDWRDDDLTGEIAADEEMGVECLKHMREYWQKQVGAII